ncbi:hypothetical protein [Dyadobacter sandarakinus]|uniref:Uncharacterized protein n=1 Tax=Dyadobacter sandarakinus TaxID=2747268 RepID=A0ABX7I5H1_9BACT|nr:hypothetical protein [Dyadobacter sandarakinus]QRR00787.1 hypothetical protein HWI92_07630 [Dyadobacter sandarakinus]
MSDEMLAPIGEIIDFEIQLLKGAALSASLEIKVGEQYLVFGGPDMYESTPNAGADLTGHFLKRCFELCEATDTRQLTGELVKVRFSDQRIEAICSLKNEDWFYPALEFTDLKKDFDKT